MFTKYWEFAKNYKVTLSLSTLILIALGAYFFGVI